MKHILIAATALFSPLAAQALETTGANLDLSYGAFTEETDVSKLTLKGSAEVGFAPQFAVQADIATNAFGFTDIDGQNYALHAIFHASEDVSLGGFVGREDVESDDWTYAGLEIGQDFGRFNYEANFTNGDSDGIEVNNIGIRGGYAINGFTRIGARLDHVDVDFDANGVNFDLGDATRFGLTAEYTPTQGLMTYGELGTLDIDGLGSETYVKIGARVTFGALRGATFEQRGLQDLFPGL
ncbi:hypothetical protein [Thioclava sp. SK-1]|uniref:porin n=1 Tax=Thioclava sp. SK-1 TaxID=1889770 RepID=UPI00114D1814|nr:hypothetical protein [Thioclava sp. SK-1]